MKRLIITIFAFLSVISLLATPQLSDKAFVSLLTCTPGDAAYSRYGHTAVRIADPQYGFDAVYNFGCFDFEAKDFYWNFVKGNTMYELGVEPYWAFQKEFAYFHRQIYEQQLNLTKEQKQQLFNSLQAKLKNPEYLYNFVFDNCATRPYHHLETILAKQMQPYLEPIDWTFRQAVNHYNGKYTWARFGINLAFGADADRQMTEKEQLFLPERLMLFIEHTNLTTEPADSTLTTNTIPLVSHLTFDGNNLATAPAFNINEGSFARSPQLWFSLFILLYTSLVLFDYKRKKTTWIIDAVLLFLMGIVGCLLVFLSFFSIHPLVGHNYNLIFFSPLTLLFAIAICLPRSRRWLYRNGHRLTSLLLMLLAFRLIMQPWHTSMALVLVLILRFWLTSEKSFLPKRAALVFIGISLFNSVLASPKLTVVVSVDGLSEEAMHTMQPYFEQGGLRTLCEEAHHSTLNFSQLLYGGNEALATVLTGHYPNRHGITSDSIYNPKTRRLQSAFLDSNSKGIGTTDRLSCSNLLLPTIADQHRLQYGNNAKIFAIATNAGTALLLAGHDANACTWQQNDQWVSTDYYAQGLPATADKANTQGSLITDKDELWQPRLDITLYMTPTYAELQKKGFRYEYKKHFAVSPLANRQAIQLALNLQKDELLGKDKTPDMLLIGLSVVTPQAWTDLLMSAEQEDMLMWLNQDLGYLIEQLNKNVGQENYRLILLGTPHFGIGQAVWQDRHIPCGQFDAERAAALINTYLMALYGHERWIDGAYANNIYLNETLIEQKKMKLADIEEQVSHFLLEFKGIETAFPASSTALLNTEYQYIVNSFNHQRFGNVVFTLQPQWQLAKPQTMYDTQWAAPLYFYTKERIASPDKQLQATDIKNIINN